MRISGRAEESVFEEETGISDKMTIPLSKEKSNRFGFIVGMFNDGLRLVLSKPAPFTPPEGKRLLHDSDETLIKFQKSMFNKYEITLEHSRRFGKYQV